MLASTAHGSVATLFPPHPSVISPPSSRSSVGELHSPVSGGRDKKESQGRHHVERDRDIKRAPSDTVSKHSSSSKHVESQSKPHTARQMTNDVKDIKDSKIDNVSSKRHSKSEKKSEGKETSLKPVTKVKTNPERIKQKDNASLKHGKSERPRDLPIEIVEKTDEQNDIEKEDSVQEMESKLTKTSSVVKKDNSDLENKTLSAGKHKREHIVTPVTIVTRSPSQCSLSPPMFHSPRSDSVVSPASSKNGMYTYESKAIKCQNYLFKGARYTAHTFASIP